MGLGPLELELQEMLATQVWERDSGPLKEQYVHLSTEPSLHPSAGVLSCSCHPDPEVVEMV